MQIIVVMLTPSFNSGYANVLHCTINERIPDMSPRLASSPTLLIASDHSWEPMPIIRSVGLTMKEEM